MKTLLTIAARGGSKGVVNKNIRSVMGKPLIAHTILQAQRWGMAEHVVVTTDSPEIAAIARDFGAEVPFLRPAELATDTAGKVEVLRHALQACEAHYQTSFDGVVDLDPTAPLRRISDIENAYQLFLEKRPKTIFSGVPCHKNPYFNMVEVGRDGYAVLCKRTAQAVLRRQDGPQVYDLNASIYVYQREFLTDPSSCSVITDRSLVYVMDSISAFDVDREIDFQFLEFILTKGFFKLEE